MAADLVNSANRIRLSHTGLLFMLLTLLIPVRYDKACGPKASRELYPVRGASCFCNFSCAAITRVISTSIVLAVTGLAT